MKRLLFFVCFMVLLSIAGQTAAQSNAPPVRELPPWVVNTYHYGIKPVAILAALLARAGWFTARTAAQGTWDTGKFIYNNPVAALVVIPGMTTFVCHALKKIDDLERQKREREELRARRYVIKDGDDQGIQNFVQENSDVIRFLQDLDMGLLDQKNDLDQDIQENSNTIIFLRDDYRLELPNSVLGALAQFAKQDDKKAAARHILSTLFTINNDS